MIGTIANTIAIVAGSCIGSVLRRGIRPEYQKVLFTAMGLASLALGFNAVSRNMPQSQYPVLFIVSLSIGALLGTILRLDQRAKQLVNRLKKNKQNTTPETNNLAEGLTTGVLLFCIGTLSIIGPINSALLNDHTFLYTNATLDLVSSAVLAATYGLGMILAAPILFCWQGTIYLIASLFGDVISDALLCELGIVGGILIAATGLSILNIKDCKTLNLLPSLLVPPLFFLIKSLF